MSPTERASNVKSGHTQALADCLSNASAIADQLAGILGPLVAKTDEFRDRMEELDLFRLLPQPQAQAGRIAVADGAYALEHGSLYDLVVVLAARTGSSPDPAGESRCAVWSKGLPRDINNDNLARGVMAANELALLASDDLDLVAYDGSHLSAIIHLCAALEGPTSAAKELAAEVFEGLRIEVLLKEFSTRPNIVALPKFDTSKALCEVLETATGQTWPGLTDELLVSLVLREGEFIRRTQVPELPWSTLNFNNLAGDWGRRLDASIEPLRSRLIDFVYLRPAEAGPAVRVEFKSSLDDQELNQLLSAISADMAAPYLEEPYNQYVVDRLVKLAGLGVSASLSAIQTKLGNASIPGLAKFMLVPYRTQTITRRI